MTRWWNDTPLWQHFVIFGLAMAMFMLGMHSWVWSSLEQSIATLTKDTEVLAQKNQESIQKISSLKGGEREVTHLSEKLFPTVQQLSPSTKPLAFRKEVVDLGKRTGVTIHIWNPQQQMKGHENVEDSLDIIVRVEGSFFGTVQFLDDLLKLSWVQGVNPLVLVRKQDSGNITLVTTDLTIKGIGSESVLQMKKLLKT